jgi:hypothetical protein
MAVRRDAEQHVLAALGRIRLAAEQHQGNGRAQGVACRFWMALPTRGRALPWREHVQRLASRTAV